MTGIVQEPVDGGAAGTHLSCVFCPAADGAAAADDHVFAAVLSAVVVLVQLAQAVAEAKASSILSTGSVQLNHVGSYLRSRHGYLVAIRHANAVKRPRAYLRMLYHKYLVIRGLEGLEGECSMHGCGVLQCCVRVSGCCVSCSWLQLFNSAALSKNKPQHCCWNRALPLQSSKAVYLRSASVR
jgi:hypothetical protein